MYSQSEVSRGQDGIIWLKRRKSVYMTVNDIYGCLPSTMEVDIKPGYINLKYQPVKENETKYRQGKKSRCDNSMVVSTA